MPTTQVLDEQSCIRIIHDDATILVHKEQVRTIDTLHGDTVRIDMGEGALYHVYVRLQDLIGQPNVTTVEQLRELIKGMLDTPAIDTGVGDATAENQEDQITQLSVISQTLLDMKILMTASNNFNDASRIDESVPYVVYKGFAMPGTEPNSAAWAIQKISRKQDIIVYEWADGNNQFNHIWDNRYALTYLPLLNGAG